MAQKNKKFKAGVMLLVASFFCLGFVFYFLGSATMESMSEVEDMNEQMTMLEIEKENTEKQLNETKGQLNTIKLEHILKSANRFYSKDDINKKEGLLWVDKDTSRYVITLGALNGLKPGSKLVVYDGNNQVGKVVVDTPLDIISYVSPVTKSLQKLSNNNYRVVIE